MDVDRAAVQHFVLVLQRNAIAVVSGGDFTVSRKAQIQNRVAVGEQRQPAAERRERVGQVVVSDRDERLLVYCQLGCAIVIRRIKRKAAVSLGRAQRELTALGFIFRHIQIVYIGAVPRKLARLVKLVVTVI